ncbi:MAG: recombinase family protein [Thomasclavelia sp.]|nr:recombinase family protein [Thomasclavelia sp.]
MTKSYGYRSSRSEITVIDYEAMVVREAYSLYLKGYFEMDIENEFVKRNYLNKSGIVDWSYGRIRDMLTNFKYIGDSVGPKSYSKSLVNKKRYKNDYVLDQYYAEDNHQAIL